MAIDALLKDFNEIANNPKAQLASYKSQGYKAIGCMPYYAPEELVHAAGMVPFGLWGTNDKYISLSKEYCASFYCSLAQLDLEMLLDGTLDDLDGVITSVLCDTLRPMSQNIRVAMEKMGKMPVIFLAHPQNRAKEYGIRYSISQYTNVKEELEKIAGKEITDQALSETIKVYNRNRQARRKFVKLVADHPEAVSAVDRGAVLKASYFMRKEDHTKMLEELNKELEALPESNWQGVRLVTSGIICDNPTLLSIFDKNDIAIVADDVANESRSFRVDAPEEGDPMEALARQFGAQDYDVLLYDEESHQNRRADYVVNLVKENKADGLVVFMMTFCDPEEMEYPYLNKALNDAGVRHVKIGVDMQMRDFGQLETALQALADEVKANKAIF